MATKICLFSWNSRGWGDQTQKVCKSLSLIAGDKVPIICNQENFLLRANAYMVNKALPNFHVVFKPAIKETLNGGRPKNGMFVAIPLKYKEQVTDVSPDHWRIQAVTIKCNENATNLVINSYFPVDNRNLDHNNVLTIKI